MSSGASGRFFRDRIDRELARVVRSGQSNLLARREPVCREQSRIGRNRRSIFHELGLSVGERTDETRLEVRLADGTRGRLVGADGEAECRRGSDHGGQERSSRRVEPVDASVGV
ncbi:hypothetical protein [Halostagnicola sp. A56]|uniref:hypothetical protein n=1 Tax=Halostagnicola sp. A56 TaxID=1495067 RepID=UPI001E3C84E8|nr:hypothetical protein [Halostagnicola sp. A56]